VILAGWNNFRGMVTGFEVVKETTPAVTGAVEETTTDNADDQITSHDNI
jgi:hypothetical protein